MTGTTTRFSKPAEWYTGAAASTEHRYAVTEEHRRPNRSGDPGGVDPPSDTRAAAPKEPADPARVSGLEVVSPYPPPVPKLGHGQAMT